MSIVKRGKRTTAQVRYKGVSIAQTFDSKTAAATWTDKVRSAIDRGVWPVRDLIPPHLWPKWNLGAARPSDANTPHTGWTLRKALEVYRDSISETKKGATQEINRINQWCERPLAKTRLDQVSANEIQKHITARLGAGRAANTVRNEVFLLSAVFEHARASDIDGTGEHGWGLTSLVNPVPQVNLPPPPPPRNRRLEDGDGDADGEENRMREALLKGQDGKEMLTLFVLAIETGMRLGELLDIRAGQLRQAQDTRFIYRPDSKNSSFRRVILSTRAAAEIDALLAEKSDLEQNDRLFRLGVDAVEWRWAKARTAAGIEGLHFHDLRHEGLSRMAELGLNIGELKGQSGHKTAQVLLGYVNAKPAAVAKKLG